MYFFDTQIPLYFGYPKCFFASNGTIISCCVWMDIFSCCGGTCDGMGVFSCYGWLSIFGCCGDLRCDGHIQWLCLDRYIWFCGRPAVG